MALPTEPRSCACSFLKVLLTATGSSRYLQILGFQISQVRGRGQRLARRLLDEFLNRQARANAVDVVAQPFHDAAEPAGGYFFVETGTRGAHGFIQLGGDDRSPGGRGEKAEV